MGKFSNVFFASDFDHTLTGLDNRIRRNNLDAIRYFMQEGGIFTVASGRSIPMFRQRSVMVPVNAPCILYNGCACYDYQTKELFFSYAMDEFIFTLIDEVRRMAPDFFIEVQGIAHHYVLGGESWRDKFLRDEGVEVIHCPLQEIPAPWMKLLVCSAGGDVLQTADQVSPEEHKQVAQVVRRLTELTAGKCYVTRSLPRVIEIGAPDGDKGSAARALARKYGRPILACAGDAPNDLTMLREADFSFTPCDHDPGLTGDYIETCSCNDGCVADAIARLEKLL